MTLKEIRKIIDNTKVYVNGKSKEIQEKLFSFGYRWSVTHSTEVGHETKPFLFIYKDKDITYANDMCDFTTRQHREISADEILSLEVTEPSYRPFKSQEECFDEMKKHIPFGWLKAKQNGCLLCIGKVLFSQEDKNVLISFSTNESLLYSCFNLFEEYTFADGTPFGIKEE